MTESQYEKAMVPLGRSSSARDSLQMELGRELLTAAKDGKTARVEELIVHGAPFSADWVGTTPLHHCAYYNHIALTEVLLLSGIAQDARNKVDRTPLHTACQMGNMEIVRMLLAFNADVNNRDMLKMTPLHWAVYSGKAEIVKLILSHGANITCIDKFGKSVTDIAEDRSDYNIVKLIQAVKNMSASKRASILSSAKKKSAMYAEKMKGEGDMRFGDDVSQKPPAKKKKVVILDRQLENAPNGIQRVLVTNDYHPFIPVKIKEEPVSPPPTFTEVTANTLHLLQQHGISMLEPDTGTVVSSAVQSGQSVELTEAGKLALNSSKPMRTVQINTSKAIILIPKPGQIMKSNGVNGIKPITKGLALNILESGKKIIKVNAEQLIKMTSQKKFIIKQASTDTSSSPPGKLLDGKLYTNIDLYIERIKIKKQECDQNIEELEKLLADKHKEATKLNFLLRSAIREKSEKKQV